MQWVNKHYIGITTTSAAVLTVITIFCWDRLTALQRADAFLMLLFAAHLWEENKFPGGFHEMVLGKLQLSYGTLKVAGTFQLVLIVGYRLLAFVLPQYHWIAMILAILGLLEAIAHTAMVKVFRQDKPYSPGMVTAYCMAVLSVWEMVYTQTHGFMIWWQWLTAILLMVVSFLLGVAWMLRQIDLKPGELIKRVRGFMATGSPE